MGTVEATRQVEIPDESAIDEDADAAVGGAFDVRTATGLAVLSAAYISLLYVTTFVVSTILFLAAAVFLLGERRPARILAYSVGFALLIWGVFVRWLLVPLP